MLDPRLPFGRLSDIDISFEPLTKHVNLKYTDLSAGGTVNTLTGVD
jgi:hypothetical protein